MPNGIYSPLADGSIRLLELLPSEGGPEQLRSNLREYPLRNLESLSHLYEALSYVWGSENKPQSIVIGNQRLDITQNLYAALLQLQHHSYPRILWIDAICIDQTNEREKEHQIPLMAEIYAKARCVLIWLGEVEDDGGLALEAICDAGNPSTDLSHAQSFQGPILKLLQRSWFQRIWVLQEVAAARHITIICGSVEIDGHAFCLGLDSLGTVVDGLTIQVTFLIRGAIFRSRQVRRDHDYTSLRICSLSELVDMYHTYSAKLLHDKVYAMLGMCAHDIPVGLTPNYNLQWEDLMHRLTKFILGDEVTIETWKNKEMAVIQGKGHVLGKVSHTEAKIDSVRDVQSVEVNLGGSVGGRSGVSPWILRTSAKPVQKGDVICFLQGASEPSIVRLRENHFMIIMIAATPQNHPQIDNHEDTERRGYGKPASFNRDFLLVWDWKIASNRMQDLQEYDILCDGGKLEAVESCIHSCLQLSMRVDT